MNEPLIPSNASCPFGVKQVVTFLNSSGTKEIIVGQLFHEVIGHNYWSGGILMCGSHGGVKDKGHIWILSPKSRISNFS